MDFDKAPAHYSADPADPVFFYKGPFSNFAVGPFTISSRQPWAPDDHIYTAEYLTVEHFYQASKARSRDAHDAIRLTPEPWEAKAAGPTTALRPDWEDVKYEVMLTGLRVKFTQPEFREALISTGDRYIAEDSPTDFIWGIRDPDGGFTGKNLLGKALMQIRDEIRAS